MGHSREAASAQPLLTEALSAEDPGQRAGSATTLSAQPMVSGISGVTGVDVPSPVMAAGRGE